MAGFAGLDVSAYPGDAKMAWLKSNTNLVWCGFYLANAPSHHDKSWMSRRGTLLAQGWGIAPIYVGQQVTGPGSKKPSAAQGTLDGDDAANLMKAAGFPAGTCVYLDLENGPPLPPKLSAYIGAWVDQVEANKFLAGVYCSHALGAKIHLLRPSARISVFKVSTTKRHPVPGHNYPDPHPGASGYDGAFIWQLGQNCQIDVNGSPLIVDLDSAVSANPGS
jgi:glycoside hydrolase-like protein